MLFSLALVFIVGFFSAEIFRLIKLPKIIGMLLTGIVIGPYVLDLIDPTLLGISDELRKIALIIILIKAGLSLNLADLKKVGREAVLMSFLPATFEIIGYMVFAPLILGISFSQALLMGSVLSAVSPAVVVPRMVKLIEEKRGTEKGVPQLVLAGATCDDVFVIVVFSVFLAMEESGVFKAQSLFNIPVSIVSGVVLGALFGVFIYLLFKFVKINLTIKTIIVLSVAFLLVSIEDTAEDYIAISGLLSVMTMACVLKLKQDSEQSKKLSLEYGQLWIGAEVLLFVLVGAAVDIRYTFSAGLSAIALIFIALAIRTLGVLLCLVKTKLNKKERLFCVIAYLPKATVQAAIGAVPLASGLECGNIILSVAVLAILITAPLGAIGIDYTYKKLLQKIRIIA